MIFCVRSAISNLAYLHRSSNEYSIAVKASLSEVLVATNRGRAQIVRIRELHRTVALLPRAFSLLLRSCNLAFINATEFLRRAGRRELGRAWRVPWHKVQTACASLVEEDRKAGR